MTRSRFLLAALVLLASACASRGPRAFPPAGPEEARQALAAWTRAVERADSLAPGRLLYECRVSQGLFHVSGTLAVVETRESLEATLTGPFGSPVARYSDGALRGEGIRPLSLPAEQLRWLLAGVWKAEGPSVAGFEGGDALLRWSVPVEAAGVLDVATSRFGSIEVSRAEGRIRAGYSGLVAGRPGSIEIEDLASGGKLRLTLVAAE